MWRSCARAALPTLRSALAGRAAPVRSVVTILRSTKPPPQTVVQAVKAVLEGARAKPRKFDETVEMQVVLGVDPRRADEIVKGSALLPHGTGKPVRVGVFASGEQAEAARAAGADFVGEEDFVDAIQRGEADYDRVLATPDALPFARKVARVLGPKGLMPNPKLGTVAEDIGEAVKNAKGGEVIFRTKKKGELNLGIGKVSFSEEKLLDNLRAYMLALQAAKPEAASGRYLKQAVLCSTMGRGIKVRVDTLDPSSPRFMQDR